MGNVDDQQDIREIEHGSPQYQATVDLRDTVLRKPLGLRFSAEELKAENDCRHVACYHGDRLVGCLVLQPVGGGDVRMKQVAVVPELQGQGIGTALVPYARRWLGRLDFAAWSSTRGKRRFLFTRSWGTHELGGDSRKSRSLIGRWKNACRPSFKPNNFLRHPNEPKQPMNRRLSSKPCPSRRTLCFVSPRNPRTLPRIFLALRRETR